MEDLHLPKELVIACVCASVGYVLKSVISWVTKRLERSEEEQIRATKANTEAIIELEKSIDKMNFQMDLISKNLALIPSMQKQIAEHEAKIREMKALMRELDEDPRAN